jgi:hypothetical protein
MWLAAVGGARAQQIEFAAEVDTNYLLIGDQVKLRLKVKAEEGVTVTFPLLRDTVVNGLEIVSGPVRDSTREKRRKLVMVEECYVLTAFDTGVYVVPSLPIKVEGEGYSTVVRTDPLSLVVNTLVVDDEKGAAGIVPPKDAPWIFAEMVPYLFWVLLGLVVCAGGALLVWRLRSRKPLFAVERPAVPPYTLAMEALDRIKEEKPWQNGLMKVYYTRLTETLRAYLEGELEVPALERTTREILLALEERKEVEKAERRRLGELLEEADLVKFAKASPSPEECLAHWQVAYQFVEHVHGQLAVEEEAKREDVS